LKHHQEELKTLISSLKDQFSDFETQLVDKSEEVTSLIASITTLKHQLKESETLLDMNEDEKKDNEDTITQFQSEINNVKRQMSELEEKNALLEASQKSDEKTEVDKQIADLEQRLEMALDERQAMQLAKDSAEGQLNSLRSELEAIRIYVGDREKELQSLSTDLDERIAENLSYLHEIESLRARNSPDVESLKQENADLTEQCIGLGSEVETLQGWLSRFKDVNVDHQSKEKDLAQENQDLNRRLAELEQNNHKEAAIRAENERLETAYEELKTSYESIYVEFTDLQNRHDSLKLEFDLLQSEKDKWRSERAQLTEIEQLKLALVDKDVLISDLESKFESEVSREEIEELQKEATRLSEIVRQNDEKWKTRDQEMNELLVSFEAVQSQLAQRVQEYEALKNQLEACRSVKEIQGVH
jgi:chromosome segregation ATPase